MRKLSRKQKTVALIGGVALLVAGGTGAALATADDDATDRPIEGPALEQAEKAALEETGGGEVTETEVDDEESKYEVEVTLEDGSQVDVQLDEDFQVVGSESDGTSDAEGGED